MRTREEKKSPASAALGCAGAKIVRTMADKDNKASSTLEGLENVQVHSPEDCRFLSARIIFFILSSTKELKACGLAEFRIKRKTEQTVDCTRLIRRSGGGDFRSPW